MMAIQNKIAQVIEAQGLSMYEVAKRADLTYPTVYNLAKRGTARIDIETLNKLCNTLNVGPGELFVWTPEASTEAK